MGPTIVPEVDSIRIYSIHTAATGPEAHTTHGSVHREVGGYGQHGTATRSTDTPNIPHSRRTATEHQTKEAAYRTAGTRHSRSCRCPARPRHSRERRHPHTVSRPSLHLRVTEPAPIPLIVCWKVPCTIDAAALAAAEATCTDTISAARRADIGGTIERKVLWDGLMGGHDVSRCGLSTANET